MKDLLNLDSYDYNLPKELIAQTAFDPADECKLLYCKNWEIKDLIFKNIENLIWENDVLFLNNSKVIKARIRTDETIIFNFISQDDKNSVCNKCEMFFLKDLWQNEFEALVYPWKKFKVWKQVDISRYRFEIVWNTEEWRIIKYLWKESIIEVFDKLWSMPLPPYIEYKKDKEAAYQPVFAQTSWSVAAPTASLHFTEDLLKRLEKKWVKKLYSTLHIWLGTFKVVDVQNIKDYEIHSETVQIPIDMFKQIWELKEKWKNLIAVWTTATRILESLPYLYKKLEKTNKLQNNYFDSLDVLDSDVEKFISWDILIENWIISFDTKLFIYPWFKYKLVDKLITNFHLPKSSLLMLVVAFMWYENMMKAYEHAIKNKYRFFSFGDAMMIE